MWYFERTAGVEVHVSDSFAGAARLLEFELFWEDQTSLDQAAELFEMPVGALIVFAAQRPVLVHYGLPGLHEDRQAFQRLSLCMFGPVRIGRLE